MVQNSKELQYQIKANDLFIRKHCVNSQYDTINRSVCFFIECIHKRVRKKSLMCLIKAPGFIFAGLNVSDTKEGSRLVMPINGKLVNGLGISISLSESSFFLYFDCKFLIYADSSV